MRKTHRPLTTLALALSISMAALEMTVVSTAMPTVVGELGGIQHYAWVFTAYMLSSTITVPIYGKLADLYGRKPILLFGILLFLVASVASGLSSSMGWLIAFRALQGLGAGSMQPIALVVIGDIYKLEERARVQGVFSAVWGVSGLVGPLAGGLIVKWLSWHWVFFINVPVGLGAAALLVVFFHESVERKKVALDVFGALLLAAGVVALLLGAQREKERLVPLLLAAVLLVAFVFAERRAKEAILPLHLFRRPAIAVSSTAGMLFSAAQFGATIYVPLFVQGVLGGTPTQAGGMITPLLVAWPLAAVLGGKLLVKVGFRPLIVGGLGTASAATVAMALLLKPGAPLLLAQLAMALFGGGMGFTSTALLIAVQTSVGWELRGVATASNMFFRTIGGALGVGVMGGVLVTKLTADPRVPVSAANALLGPEHGKGLGPEVLQQLSGSLATGLATNFWLIAAASLLAFVCGLFFPKVTTGEKVNASSEAMMH